MVARMKRLYFFILFLFIFFFLAGCPVNREFVYSINVNSGTVKITYRDIVSTEKADTSIAKDWHAVKKLASISDSTYDPDVITCISQRVFQEDTVLSGEQIFKVKCPKCFPSTLSILDKTVDKYVDEYLQSVRWEEINGEIYLFAFENLRILKSNGMLFNTDSTSISVWPDSDTLFEFTLAHQEDVYKKGTSLLPYFRKDKK
jgi:hypothetical protein